MMKKNKPVRAKIKGVVTRWKADAVILNPVLIDAIQDSLFNNPPSKINLNTLINLNLNIKDRLYITVETDDGHEFEIRVEGKVKI